MQTCTNCVEFWVNEIHFSHTRSYSSPLYPTRDNNVEGPTSSSVRFSLDRSLFSTHNTLVKIFNFRSSYKKKQNSQLLKFQLTFIFDKNAQNRTKFVRPRPGSRLTSKAFPPFIDLNNKFKFWKWGWFKKQQKTAPTTARVKWANCRRAFSWKKKFNLAFLFFS